MRRYGGFGFGSDRISMEGKEESLLGKDGGGAGGGKNTPFVDRSKVRILLCDNDVKSSKEVFELLCKCSYQVTSVRTPRQVIDALNAEGRDIDIILAEVDLPVAKGLKMLKYIMRDKELQRIPIIMMSAKDEVSVVVKCLKRGAADYLVKPLRTNELLNLWTHMWRRREMLGLAEKNILSYDFDLVASDPSDPNTSTTLFSDDTDDRRRGNIPEITVSNIQEDECNTATFMEPPSKGSPGYNLDSPGPSKRMGQISSFLKKSELKVGISSAFFTYVKSNVTTNNSQMVGCAREDDAKSEEHSHREQNQLDADFQRQETGVSQGNHSHFRSSDNDIGIVNVEKPCTSQVPLKSPDERNSKEEQFSTLSFHHRNETQVDVSGVQALTPFPYYMSGMANQVVIPSPAQLYQGNLHDLPKNSTTSMLPQYNPFHQHPHMPGVSSFPYYPVRLCLQPGQMPTTHLWPSNGNSTSNEVKPTRLERREAALIKFRQKRKDRCFDKKIRYINRKKLAERRPRVRGQFVRQVNGVDVDLNGRPDSVDDFDEEEDVDEEELTYRDSSLDGDTSGF